MKYLSLRNRTILGALVRTDFKIRYQGSVLGYAWSLLRPLLVFAVLYVVFVYIFPLGKGVEHFPTYLLTGIIFWNYFVESTVMGLTSVVARGDLLRKINLPRYLLVFSSALSSLINFGFGFVVLSIFALLDGIVPSISWLLVIPLVCELAIFSLGISLLLSSLYVRYRDISYIWEVFIQMGFYASAIIFPLSSVSESIRKWFFLNPIVQIIQDARYVIATNTSATIWSTTGVGWIRMLFPFILIICFIIIGTLVFRKRSKTFAEEI